MTRYGTRKLSPAITFDKKRFGSNQNLKFANVVFLAAYDPHHLTAIPVTMDGNAGSVATGDAGCVVIAIGPSGVGFNMKDASIVDTMYDTTLEVGMHCIVLEGAVVIDGKSYSADEIIPYFVSETTPINLNIFGMCKLLMFRVE